MSKMGREFSTAVLTEVHPPPGDRPEGGPLTKNFVGKGREKS